LLVKKEEKCKINFEGAYLLDGWADLSQIWNGGASPKGIPQITDVHFLVSYKYTHWFVVCCAWLHALYISVKVTV